MQNCAFEKDKYEALKTRLPQPPYPREQQEGKIAGTSYSSVVVLFALVLTVISIVVGSYLAVGGQASPSQRFTLENNQHRSY